MAYPLVWSAEPTNLLSPEVVTRVRNALDAGMLCGVHAFFAGGCSPEPCAFVDLDSYILTVERSRPGDWFTLWSVPSLADQGPVLIRKQRTQVTEDELHKAKDWLDQDPMREYLAAGHCADGVLPWQSGEIPIFLMNYEKWRAVTRLKGSL